MEKKETTAQNPEEQGKYTYEQLNDICSQLFAENQRLSKQLQGTGIMFKRLDYLFKVLEFAGVIKDPEFIGNCVDEIKNAIAVKEERSEGE